MFYALISANTSRIVHVVPLHLHIFLDMLEQKRAIILCFCLSSSPYSNDLTLCPLLANDDDDACEFYSLAEMLVNYLVA